MSNKVPVSQRALNQRIQRKLASKNQLLVKSRGREEKKHCGDYYLVQGRKDVSETHIDIVALGRKLGVLKPWEEMLEA